MSDGTSQRARPAGRWLLAVALLIAEYVLALIIFDSDRLPVGGNTWSFAFIGQSMALIIVAMTATLLIGGD